MTADWTASSVRTLFASSQTRSDRALAGEHARFATLLNTQQVLCEYSSYAKPPEPTPCEMTWYHSAFAGNTSEEHGILKWGAWRWLRTLGEPMPQYEVRLSYGIADVVAPTLKCVVECGDTAPRKVVHALRSGWRCFVLFPFAYVDIPTWKAAGYPKEHEQWTVRTLARFTCNPEVFLEEDDLFHNNAAGQVGL